MKILKRLGDLFFSLTSILILSPIFLLIYFLIFFDDKGDPIFKQMRIGYKGKLFKMYKFRTMNVGSEKEGTGYFCYEDDKRITRLGRILRKYSLDEIPQLFNIFEGKMSLVGPRPAIYDELDSEKIDQANIDLIYLRTLVKPGLTGYAQVISRNDLNWNDKLKLDKEYLMVKPGKRIILDIKIIFLTVKELFFSSGVYDKK